MNQTINVFGDLLKVVDYLPNHVILLITIDHQQNTSEHQSNKQCN
jgi:hypothetical protein